MGYILKKKTNFILNFWKGSSFFYLSFGLIKKGGRNSFGNLTSHKKSYHFKRKYRVIDYSRNLFNIPGIVLRIEYDPNRTCFIALICYKNGFISYILAVENINLNDVVINYNFFDNSNYNLNNISIKSQNGSSFFLDDIPMGTLVCHIEKVPNNGACFCRAAGTFGVILNKYFIYNKNFVLVRLPSGVEYLLLNKCRAVIGISSNSKFNERLWKKAGVSRNFGIKPTVRGVAMNPIDHPHGGGEGKKSPKPCAMSPWGKLSKGIKTRKFFFSNKFILKKRNG